MEIEFILGVFWVKCEIDTELLWGGNLGDVFVERGSFGKRVSGAKVDSLLLVTYFFIRAKKTFF